jgi:NhaA family Na+:H+ antiporter
LAVVRTLKVILDRLEPPAQRLEHSLQPWTTYLVLPVFALANAGIALGSGALKHLGQPVGLGIIVGLVLGKPLGVSLFAWLSSRLGLAEMPPDVGWRQFLSASFLAGIGFTISLFIAQSAFVDPGSLATAKSAILVASSISALLGWTLLNWTSPRYDRVTAGDEQVMDDRI